jgi:hypothetical protein
VLKFHVFLEVPGKLIPIQALSTASGECGCASTCSGLAGSWLPGILVPNQHVSDVVGDQVQLVHVLRLVMEGTDRSRNGTVQEYIVAGTSKEEFQKRLKAVITSNPPSVVAQSSPPARPDVVADTTNSTTTNPTDSVPATQPQTSTTVQAAAETSDRGNRRNIRAGKQPARETAEETGSPAGNERSKLQVKEKREQVVKLERKRREERERIRNQIQQDKEERKRREAEEKARHTAATAAAVAAAATPESSLSRSKPAQQCRLQVRLFDGSSVRTSFPPTATIHANVRPWLDAHRSDGNSPYTLKHILTPLPNHTISDAEEERTLEDLSLGPTANLIMVPVPSYIDAYASSSSVASLPFRAASAGYGLMSGAVGAVAGTVGSFLGYGAQQQPTGNNPVDGTTAQQASGPTRSGPSSRGAGINIRTLHDQRDGRDDRQFYNGNQVFTPSCAGTEIGH